MDLKEFTSGTPSTKPWLDINANSVNALTGSIDEVSTNLLSLADTAGVPNPPVGYVTFFSDGTDYKSTNPLGVTTTFMTSAVGPFLPTAGGQMSGDIDMDGNDIIDCPTIDDIADDVAPLANQLEPVAPYGQRDLWQFVAVAPAGDQLHYSTAFNYTYAGGVNAASYSTNGGTTFAAVVFDVAPVGTVRLSSKTGLAVATTDAQSYTSADGINFTQQAAALPGIPAGYGIFYSSLANLFMIGSTVDGTHGIITSPDGVVWTARVSNSFVNSIRGNSSVIVAVGDTAPYAMWSVDGITWTDTATPLANPSRTIGYSNDQQIWISSGRATNETYWSVDGKAWVDTGIAGPGFSGPSLNWLGAPYNAWYAASSYLGNYSIFHSPDPRKSAFRAIALDGALAGLIDYFLEYIPSLDRLVLSTTTAPYIAFNVTKRPYDIKSVRDNIRVRGAPVAVAQYSVYADVPCSNTVVETDVSVSASSVGTRALQQAQPVGMVAKLHLYGLATSAAGDTLTLRYYAGTAGTTLLFTHALTIPALSVNLPIYIRSNLTVRAATIQVNSADWNSAVIISAAPAYNPAILNTLRVTAQWGANVNQFVMNQFFVGIEFRNGA